MNRIGQLHARKPWGNLLETLLGADSQKAFIVFASVRDAQTRLRMIERLLHLTHGQEYDTFWNDLSKKLQKFEQSRNPIAHWIVLEAHCGGRKFSPSRDIFLQEHPNIYAGGQLFISHLREFEKQADFYRLLVYYFHLYLKNPAFLSHDEPLPAGAHGEMYFASQ